VRRGGRWFLPEESDVLGLLRRQLAVTIEGMDAFSEWAQGDADAAQRVRDAEHRADTAKRDVQSALRSAFVLPMEPEDLFALSRGSDWVINHAKDLVRESDVMAFPPDATVAEMASLLAGSVHDLGEAVARLAAGSGDAVEPANAAAKAERRLEKVYRKGMAALLDVEDLREVTARRELYRRCSQMGDTVADVAERVIYAMVKET
jgi:uncharacterized protein Yka (UPF0111/DUF47 family)